jgi:hypothetical protein
MAISTPQDGDALAQAIRREHGDFGAVREIRQGKRRVYVYTSNDFVADVLVQQFGKHPQDGVQGRVALFHLHPTPRPEV